MLTRTIISVTLGCVVGVAAFGYFTGSSAAHILYVCIVMIVQSGLVWKMAGKERADLEQLGKEVDNALDQAIKLNRACADQLDEFNKLRAETLRILEAAKQTDHVESKS